MRSLSFNIFIKFLEQLAKLPLWMLYGVSDFIYILLYWVIRYRRKVIKENLKNAFPEKTNWQRRRIGRRFMRHLCSFSFETIKMMMISEEEMQKRVVVNNDYFKVKSKEDRNIVAMLGHNANWEWLTSISLQDSYHWTVPYHPLSNRNFNAFMKDLRSRFGPEPVAMKRTFRRLVEINKNGRLFAAGMIADQSPPNPKNRRWITFLNQDTAVMEGPERIARKSDAIVVFCRMNRVKRGYYSVDVIPITEDIASTDDFFITKKYYELLEEQINEQPEYWLWSHRRWKRKRPADEKLIRI